MKWEQVKKDAREVIKIINEGVSAVVTVEYVSRGTTSAVKGTMDFSRGGGCADVVS